MRRKSLKLALHKIVNISVANRRNVYLKYVLNKIFISRESSYFRYLDNVVKFGNYY